MTSLQKGFLFDPNRCLGCRSCQMACAVNRHLPAGVFFRRVTAVELQREAGVAKYYLSTSCNHCESPECFRTCPEAAYRKRRDGVVTHEPSRCTGCGTCLRGCPFGAVTLNPETARAEKCQLCHERLDAGERPYCVGACPVTALMLIDLPGRADDPYTRTLPGVPRVQLTRPSLRFRPLHMGLQICQRGRKGGGRT